MVNPSWINSCIASQVAENWMSTVNFHDKNFLHKNLRVRSFQKIKVFANRCSRPGFHLESQTRRAWLWEVHPGRDFIRKAKQGTRGFERYLPAGISFGKPNKARVTLKGSSPDRNRERANNAETYRFEAIQCWFGAWWGSAQHLVKNLRVRRLNENKVSNAHSFKNELCYLYNLVGQ